MNRGSTIKHPPFHSPSINPYWGCLSVCSHCFPLCWPSCTNHTSSAYTEREDKSLALASCSSLISHFFCCHSTTTTGVGLQRAAGPTGPSYKGKLWISHKADIQTWMQFNLGWGFINTGRWPKHGQPHKEVVLLSLSLPFPSPVPTFCSCIFENLFHNPPHIISSDDIKGLQQFPVIHSVPCMPWDFVHIFSHRRMNLHRVSYKYHKITNIISDLAGNCDFEVQSMYFRWKQAIQQLSVKLHLQHIKSYTSKECARGLSDWSLKKKHLLFQANRINLSTTSNSFISWKCTQTVWIRLY